MCWDIGAGTGGVSVELALQSKAVWAVERNPEALELLRANRKLLCAWKLRIVEGRAPEALDGLPAPDAVFVGGSGGELPRILQAVHDVNPRARVCVSAIALETLHTALKQEERWPAMGAHGQQLLSSTYSPAAWLRSMEALLGELRVFHSSSTPPTS